MMGAINTLYTFKIYRHHVCSLKHETARQRNEWPKLFVHNVFDCLKHIIHIQGGPKRMQRLWSVISTTFLIECHWCLLYWIFFYIQVIWHQVWIRRFDSRAIFLRQCHFQNVLLSPPQAGLKQREFFSSDGIPLRWLWKGRQHEWNRGIHYATLCTIIGKVPQSCVMNASVSFIWSSFSKWGQLCFCQHSWFNGTPSDEENKLPLLQACLRGGGGGSSTFWKWHYLRKIALESKRLINTWWTWCQITWKRKFHPLQQKINGI